MSTADLLNIAYGIGAPPVATLAWMPVGRLLHWKWYGFRWEWMATAVVQVVLFSAIQQWSIVIGCVISALIAAALWWWRRKGKRAVQLLGAKSRARRDALVRRARELARPRPVLSPAPGGVR